MGHPYWPLFDITIRSERLELRLPTDDEITGLIAAAKAGVHDRDMLPFNVDWTAAPSPRFEMSFAAFHWSQRANWTIDDWNLVFAVFIDGEPSGLQSIGAKNFPKLSRVDTGSWLTKARHGMGYGTEMRAAVLHFAFAQLGAEEAHSEARAENTASQAVSRRLGYRDNGVFPAVMSDQPAEARAFRLTRTEWETNQPPGDVSVSGFDDCRPFFYAA